MRKALTITGLILLIILIPSTIMIRNADAAPVQRNLRIELDGLPPDTPPLRVVLLSDFHVADFGNTPERFRETVRRVTALHPDVVLLAGDFLQVRHMGGFPVRDSVAPLAGLKASFGVFAVLGNHDYVDAPPETVQRELRNMHVQVLDNSAARAGPLAVLGVSDAFSKKARVRDAISSGKRVGGVPIVVTHTPTILLNLPQSIQLAVAGHTHCGQVVLPVIGPPKLPFRSGSRQACGIIRDGQRTNIITAGLGVSNLPFRLRAPPDFWVITVVPRKAE